MKVKVMMMAVLLGVFFTAGAQNAKSLYKKANKAFKAGQYEVAIASYSEALQLEPAMESALLERAQSYERTGKPEKAVEDYRMIFEKADQSNKKYKGMFFSCGKNYLQLEKYREAVSMFDKAISLDKSYLAAYHKKALALIHLKEFNNAIEVCDKAISAGNSSYNYFYKAVAADSLGANQLAEILYYKAIALMTNSKSSKEPVSSEYKPYYVNMGIVLIKLNKLDDAIKQFDAGLGIDKNDDNILFLRGKAYFLKGDLQKSMDDLNAAIVINEKNRNAFLERGYVYRKLGQFQNAITDFTRTIVFDENEWRAYKGRGQCFYDLNKYSEAIKDFEKVSKINPNDKESLELLSQSTKKLYEMNREGMPPLLTVLSPESNDEDVMFIPDNLPEITVKGKVKDDSRISSILVGNVSAVYDKDAINPSFSAKIPAKNLETLSFKVTDVYDNVTSALYSIKKTETNPPVVKMVIPAATPENEIFLTGKDQIVFVEGRIADESRIKSIVIEGISASFDVNSLNPTFSANINIFNKDTLNIHATDVLGNITVKKYTLHKDTAANPMGRTWAVFIDNSNYNNFQPLSGTSADITVMRSALAGYRFDKTLTKKDLSKKELEKFFSIELRDMLRDNQINSLLIWYSGHGKFLNETGYWIPVDAARDDEFTYYSLNHLKGCLASYQTIQHHLVISDACETGPAFYLAMRDVGQQKVCGDWNYAKFKSSQVLTSSNTETSADNSVFTKTFSSALAGNPDECISIDQVAEKVISSVKKNQKQNPRFGNILGIEDSGGTFFFIKRK